jgi:hypothetical protein
MTSCHYLKPLHQVLSWEDESLTAMDVRVGTRDTKNSYLDLIALLHITADYGKRELYKGITPLYS